jgi:hypothetical protein
MKHTASACALVLLTGSLAAAQTAPTGGRLGCQASVPWSHQQGTAGKAGRAAKQTPWASLSSAGLDDKSVRLYIDPETCNDLNCDQYDQWVCDPCYEGKTTCVYWDSKLEIYLEEGTEACWCGGEYDWSNVQRDVDC